MTFFDDHDDQEHGFFGAEPHDHNGTDDLGHNEHGAHEHDCIPQHDSPFVVESNHLSITDPLHPEGEAHPLISDPNHPHEDPFHPGSDIHHLPDSITTWLGESIHVGHEAHVQDGTWYPPTFNPQSGHEGVIGDPTDAMEVWHLQQHDDTCAVVSQQYILQELTGQHISEDQLREIAYEHGWYTPGGGTTPENVGNLLEYFGLNVEKHDGSSISELEHALYNGQKVIVGIDSNEIWHPGSISNFFDSTLSNLFGIPDRGANHAVEVTGIDTSDPSHPMVVLNDPGHPGGEGEMVPLHDFENAWQDSNNFIVTTTA